MFSTSFDNIIKEMGVKPYRISKETGIPQSTLSDYRLGKAQPTVEKIELIADYLGISVDRLLGRDTRGNSPISDELAGLVYDYQKLDWEGKKVVIRTIDEEIRRVKRIGDGAKEA